MPGKDWLVLILTKDEESSIFSLIREIRAIFRSVGLCEPRIFLSDDSRDRTAEIAASLGATVIPAGGRGLGWAYTVGLRHLALEKADGILTLDGDGQVALEEIPRFMAPVSDNRADLVVGSRFLGGNQIDYIYPSVNRRGVHCLSRYITWMTRQKFTDSHGGLRALRPDLAAKLEIFGKHTYVQESIIDAVEKGFRVQEVPSAWRKRKQGTSRVVRSKFKYAIRTVPYLAFRIGRRLWI